MARVYLPDEIETSVLRDKVIAAIGYGYQGRRFCTKLRNDGFKVIVGSRRPGRSFEQAVADGMEAYTIEEAAERGDVAMLLIGDESQPQVYREQIEGKLRENRALVFASGWNLYYGLVQPLRSYDAILVAPVTPAVVGVGVDNDASGEAWKIGLALAKLSTPSLQMAVATSFGEEVVTDEFHAIADCTMMLQLKIYDMLVEAGYSSEMAYFNTIGWITAKTEDAFRKRGADGLEQTFNITSDTAKYSRLVHGYSLVNRLEEMMRDYLKKVENGEMAREWVLDDTAGRPVLNRRIRWLLEHPAIAVERSMLMKREKALEMRKPEAL